MEFEIGGQYAWISDADYQEYKSDIDLSQFVYGGDGKWYIKASDYDDEAELLDYEVAVHFFTYIKSTENVGGM